MATAEYKKKISEKLNDKVLRRNLGNFSDAYGESRATAYAPKDFPAIRQSIKKTKSSACKNLGVIVEKFKDSVTKNGGKIFEAATADDAKKYILELAKAKGAKTIVKSKSMASEEIHLNDFLVKEGLNPIETDLGEWIIQLTGEKPSHMVMPAIHKSREQVAEIFSKTLGKDIPVDIKRMVTEAREALREDFFSAKIGISGCNIAVADTGSLFLITNEGNDRLVTTVPPVHVVIMGYEKIIEKMEDAAPIIEALPRSATGQKITSYVSVITGPNQTVDFEGNFVDKELHIILLDNGRLEMAKDPVMSQAWQCIRCASCLNVCPVYEMVGGHVYGDVYAGGIGVILTSFFDSLEKVDNLQEICIACGRCKEVCPGKVPVTDLIVEIRDRLTSKRPVNSIAKFIFENIMTNRKLFHTLLKTAAFGGKPLSMGQPVMRHLPLGLTQFRSIPALATTPFRDAVKNLKQDIPATAPKIAFYVGCATDFAYPQVGIDAVKVMNNYGYKVMFPEAQNCCGTPARYMGDLTTARKLATANIEAFEALGDIPVLTVCPTCTGALMHDYPTLFPEDKVMQRRAERLENRIVEFTKFIDALPDKNCGKVDIFEGNKGSGNVKVTYHDSCHLKRNLNTVKEPREILNSLPGVEYIEMKDADRCCGCGGSFSLKFPELSAPIMDKKLKNIEESGADVLALACPGCMMQIKGGLDKQSSKVQVKHIASLMAEKLS